MNAIREKNRSAEFIHVVPGGRAAGLAKGVVTTHTLARQTAPMLDFCFQNHLDLQARIELVLFISGTVAKFHELDIGFSRLSSTSVRIEYEGGDLVCDLEDCGPIELMAANAAPTEWELTARPARRASIVQTSNLIQIGQILGEMTEPASSRPDELRSMITQATSLRTGFRYQSLQDLNQALADWLRFRVCNLPGRSTFPGRWTWA